MAEFEPFDVQYKFDATVLTESFPNYMLLSVNDWIAGVLRRRRCLFGNNIASGSFTEQFIYSLNRRFRSNFSTVSLDFFKALHNDKILMRNVLSYLLQTDADNTDGINLEDILRETGSAYAVEFGKDDAPWTFSDGETTYIHYKMKLVFRVSPVVKEQAEEVLSTNNLLSDAWASHYGLNPDDEKTVTRATDAIAGLLRDRYFPNEKRTVLGTMVQRISQNPDNYSFPASTIYEKKHLLDLMRDFSKIRGNHQSGTGRKPTHEEASFVLQYAIMLFQLLK